MEYRKIKKTKDEISTLALGAMRLDIKDKENTKETIKYAIDNGINLIDTAYLYDRGSNEKAVGEALTELNYQDKVKISTKLNRLKVKSKQDMENMFEKELESLQRNQIEYYYIHNLTSYKDLQELKKIGIYQFLEDKKEKKQILNIGFSYHGAYDDFIKIIDDYPWDMCLVQYNYIDENYQAGAKGIDYAYEKGIGIFIMEPLKGGLLAGKMPQELEPLLKDYDKTRIELALKWILKNNKVTSVLSGMTNKEMIEENINLLNNNKELTEKDLDLINKIKDKIVELNKISCSQCRYCMPCPFGVYIPDCFKYYNERYLFPDEKQYGISTSTVDYIANLMGAMGEPHDASLCKNCGKCLKECPQHINIPEELETVNKKFHTKLLKLIMPIVRKLINIIM